MNTTNVYFVEVVVHGQDTFRHKCSSIIDFLFSRQETDVRRKREHWRKKSLLLLQSFFCGHTYSTDLIGHILSASEPRRKKSRQLDESHIPEKGTMKKKKTKLSVSGLLIKSLWFESSAFFEVRTCCCCCSAYLSSCHRTASDANLLDDLHTFHCIDYFVIGEIRTCLRSFRRSNVPLDFFEFLPAEFATCSKQPNRDNHRKASYPRTHLGGQGAGWTQITWSGSS